MPYCSNCGSIVREDDRFCAKCGKPVYLPPLTENNQNSNTTYESKLIDPNLPIVRDYNDKYDNSPLDLVINAHNNGDVVATYELAYRYRDGVGGVAQDEIKSVNLYKDVLKAQNNAPAFRNVGSLMTDGVCGDDIKTKTEGIQYLEAACELGDGTAAGYLGLKYKDGLIVSKDSNKAIEYFKKSIDLGEEAGWLFLGQSYSDLERFIEAKESYEKALDYECVKYAAALELGVVYECGADGIEIDNNKALSFYEMAYNNRDKDEAAGIDARFQLAKFLFKGKSGKNEDKRAYDLFIDDIKDGYKRSNFYLGFLYWKGIPGCIDRDPLQAIKYLNDVVDRDKVNAARIIGTIYYSSLHDAKTALPYLKEAASQGDNRAQELINEIQAEQGNKTSDTVFCRKCGQAISSTSKFCSKCGTPIETTVSSKDPQQMIDRGWELLKTGKLHEARDLLAEAYKIFPDNNNVLSCYSHVIQICLASSIGIGAEGSERTKDYSNTLLKLATELKNRSYTMEEAIEKESYAHYGLGRYYQANGNMDMALEELKQVDILLTPFAAFVIWDIHVDLSQQGANESQESYNNRIRVIEKEYVKDVELLKKALSSVHFANAREKCLVYIALSAQYGLGSLYIPKNVNYAYDCMIKAHEICPEVADEEELSHFRTDSNGNLVYDP